MAESLNIVEARLREMAKREGVQMGSDVPEAVSKDVAAKFQKACERAKSNGRRTIRGDDY